MAKKLKPPYATPKRGLPIELKYDWAMGGFADINRGFLYAIREKYGAAATLEIYEMLCKMGDRVKKNTEQILKIFKIEGNDAEAIQEWWNIWFEITGQEATILELSPTITRVKVTKCPLRTEHKDISDWPIIFDTLVGKTINPKATFDRPSAMCAGDPYCELVWKIEE